MSNGKSPSNAHSNVDLIDDAQSSFMHKTEEQSALGIDTPYTGLGAALVLAKTFHSRGPLDCNALRKKKNNERTGARPILIKGSETAVLPKLQGTRDAAWIALLENVWMGACTQGDITTLRDLVIHGTPDFSVQPWTMLTLITPRNTVAAAWNRSALRAHSARTGHIIFRLPEVGEDLSKGVVELAIGMPAVAAQSDGIHYGHVVSVELDAREPPLERVGGVYLLHYLPTCVILKRLDATQEHATSHTIVGKQQLTIVPAYAIPVHKTNGYTFPAILVDLRGCLAATHFTATAHTALSRAVGPDNVKVLGDFDAAALVNGREVNGAIL
ncbi:hypothetical protein B0H11DRAFT_2249303 [Mycena galericulata]|nr:hypothetical protein B0H11DRAFT_2249303 [Mycena galericulata]